MVNRYDPVQAYRREGLYVDSADYDALAAEYGKLAPVAIELRGERDALAARLAEAMRPKQVVIKGDRYEIEPCEDGTVNIRWLGTADSADEVRNG